MRRMGCPKSWVECQTKALRGMKHAIRTSFGITKEVISNDGENNLGGIGQGAGNGPSSWHSHMLPLIDAFEELIPHRATFISPDEKFIISQWLIGFVDDNTIIFTMKDTHFKATIEEKLMEMADEVLDTWQKLVVITGGEIELDKSSISVMTWEKKKGREQLKKEPVENNNLVMKSVKVPGYSEAVDQLEICHGERLLGVRLAMDGNDDDEFQWRKDQVEELASKIKVGPPTREDAEIIYRERWVSSVGYCLPVTQFTEEQCNELMVPFYKAILPKLGFNRHLPKAVRYGPKKFNGKGLVHLAVHQHAKHLEWFVSEIRKESQLGKVLKVQMDKQQMMIGSEKHFLTMASTDIPYSEPSRIQFLWEENTKRGVTIQLASAWRQRPLREGDRAVMDIFREAGYDKEKLEILNDVRLYLHVTYISCMANARGDRIERWALFGPPQESALH